MTTVSEALAALNKAGYMVVAWSPAEMEGMSDESWCEMEEQLISKGNDLIDAMRTDDDNDDTCPTCMGCGEGRYDGTSCSTCKGKGVLRPAVEYDE